MRGRSHKSNHHLIALLFSSFESTVQINKLQDLVNRSKMARCRGRFVCPVILYNGKVQLPVPKTEILLNRKKSYLAQTCLIAVGRAHTIKAFILNLAVEWKCIFGLCCSMCAGHPRWQAGGNYMDALVTTTSSQVQYHYTSFLYDSCGV